MSDAREKLIRETFEMERDFNYWEFRQAHWDLAEVVATCPVPAEREEVLRGSWNQDAEKRFPEYRAAVAGLSMEELETEREQWLDRLSSLSERQYREILAETSSRTPANDDLAGGHDDQHPPANYRDLFEELRADYAAAKREDAHWYGPQELPATDQGYDKMLKQYADAGVNDKPQEKERGPER